MPPRPLPPSHGEKGQPLPQYPVVGFVPLAVQEEPVEPSNLDPESHPRWYKTKIALLVFSMLVSATTLGVAVAIGYVNWPYYTSPYTMPYSIEVGVAGTAAGCAILLAAVEFLCICCSKTGKGMPPGALVAFHLIIWLLAVCGVVLVTIILPSGPEYYGYWSYRGAKNDAPLELTTTLHRVLLAFNAILIVVHFILFVGACVDTSRARAARKDTVVVQVPYPYFRQYQWVAPPLGTQGPQYPVLPMGQVPAQPSQGTGSVPPQKLTPYHGYYAPAPPGAASKGPQLNNAPSQGYYAPVNVPTAPAAVPTFAPAGSQNPSQPRASAHPTAARQGE
ncbi:hypothetical protein VTK26DRAFT_1981 [Humicola hyalothermophila]